ncbi:MAG: 3'-5' exonuclease, partial [Muribaculaceae bacterium]|nr:3'-5' exonuclease [Muribaculaceae bacterium]
MKLNLKRPIIFFDLETTGTNVVKDRIVELSYIKVYPDGREETKARRINPEMHIPEQATAVHHITDEDVKDEPTFRQVSKALLAIFDGCDIAGYNSNKFDVPLLIEEFARVGLNFDISGRNFIDVQNIFHKMEQRTLVAAYRFYCGKELDGAHSALCDTQATYEVLKSQLERYDTLENDVEKLAEFSRAGRGIDLASRFVLDDNDVPILNFGKHKGKPVKEVFR